MRRRIQKRNAGIRDTFLSPSETHREDLPLQRIVSARTAPVRMRSSSSLLSPPPSPPPAPLPLASSFSSSLTGCPELDLSITLSPAPKTGHTQLKPNPRAQTRKKRDKQVCFEKPAVVAVTPEPRVTLSQGSPPQQSIRAQTRSRECHHGGAPRQSVEPPAAASNHDVGCLERAELNTTLAVKAELQSLQGAEFNSQKAVQETLQRSERTKNLINTRATEVVNVSRSQLLFTSLVSVNVQKDQLINQMVQDRLLPPARPRCLDTKAADGPSFLLFKSSDLLRQNPLPPEEEPFSYKPRPSPRPAHCAFDLHRRQRRWEATH